MSQSSEKKPADQPNAGATSNQPKLKELSPDELAKVSGGNKVSTSDIHFTHLADKSTP